MTVLNTAGYVLDSGDGEHTWFSGTLMSVKAGSEQTYGGFTLIEVATPPRFVVPPHIHDDEEEAFYVLEGQLRVTCGEQTWTVGPGDFVMMPRGIAHTCSTVGDGSARLLQITSPAGFERFIAEAGEPAAEPVVPPPGAPDIARLLRATAKYHKRMLGSPASADSNP
jgi:quercetin dioxygenase-like cupin family protein